MVFYFKIFFVLNLIINGLPSILKQKKLVKDKLILQF